MCYRSRMARLMAFEWVSLDGVFDADPAHFSRWFLPFHSEARAGCIRDTIEGADALLLGRRTYEMLARFWSAQTDDSQGPARALNALPKYVASTTLRDAKWRNTEGILRHDVHREVAHLKDSVNGTIILIGSATLLAGLLSERLVDAVRLLVHPCVMGEGRRWTSEDTPVTHLQLVESARLERGVLQLDYQLPAS